MTTSTSELTITLDLPEITFPTAEKRRHDNIVIILITAAVFGALIAGVVLTGLNTHRPRSSTPILTAISAGLFLGLGIAVTRFVINGWTRGLDEAAYRGWYDTLMRKDGVVGRTRNYWLGQVWPIVGSEKLPDDTLVIRIMVHRREHELVVPVDGVNVRVGPTSGLRSTLISDNVPRIFRSKDVLKRARMGEIVSVVIEPFAKFELLVTADQFLALAGALPAA